MKKTFVTFFPISENGHLAKDVGSIPNILAREFGYESYLAVYSRGQKFEYLDTVAKHLKIWNIKSPPNPVFYKISFQSILFFIKNSRKIDIVNFYHLTEETETLAIIYKLFNKKGVVYVKADCGAEAFVKRKGDEIATKNFITLLKDYSNKILRNVTVPQRFFNMIYKKLRHRLFRKNVDLLSVETNYTFDVSKVNFPAWKNKIIHIPNGIDFELLKSLGFEHPQKTDKENLIITVARIGLEVKNNSMMLSALNGLDLNKWTYVFIGPIEPSFENEINLFYSLNPLLKNKVIFTGAIYDKIKLYSWYKRAKVFCITSKSESWCLALCESLYFGCEVISTRISSFDDLTNQNDFGYEIQNSDDLRNILDKMVNNQIDPLANMEKIIEYSKKFSWSSICEKIHIEFKNRLK
jgi:glycosyltransferase involved in cell wall biosynthesis